MSSRSALAACSALLLSCSLDPGGNLDPEGDSGGSTATATSASAASGGPSSSAIASSSATTGGGSGGGPSASTGTAGSSGGGAQGGSGQGGHGGGSDGGGGSSTSSSAATSSTGGGGGSGGGCGEALAPVAATCAALAPWDADGAGTCRQNCGGSACQSVLTCPPGFHCNVVCSGTDACKDATVICPLGYDCNVSCMGAAACSGTFAQICSGDGACSLSCGTGTDACKDADLTCSDGPCRATCETASPTVSVDCGGSCLCADGC